MPATCGWPRKSSALWRAAFVRPMLSQSKTATDSPIGRRINFGGHNPPLSARLYAGLFLFSVQHAGDQNPSEKHGPSARSPFYREKLERMLGQHQSMRSVPRFGGE